MTRRTRTPRETALSDQALATARDLAADGKTLSVYFDYAADGSRCSWCACPLDAHDDGRTCHGCPEPSYYMASLFNGTGTRQDIPLCKGHLPDFRATVEAIAAVKGGGG